MCGVGEQHTAGAARHGGHVLYTCLFVCMRACIEAAEPSSSYGLRTFAHLPSLARAG